MANKIQGDQSPKNSAHHFWEKPIGKITISVIAGIIVFFIGFAINRHFAPKPTPGEKTDEQAKKEIPVATHDTPEKIISEVNSAPPLQRGDIAKTYVGIPIEWELYFASGYQNDKEYRLLLQPTLGISKATVACGVPKTNNEHLKRLQENTKLKVTGTIDQIESKIIFLKNASISITP